MVKLTRFRKGRPRYLQSLRLVKRQAVLWSNSIILNHSLDRKTGPESSCRQLGRGPRPVYGSPKAQNLKPAL